MANSVPAILYYISRDQVLALGNDTLYFGFKSFLQLLGFSLATPFYVKRFHDLNSPGYWVLIYWACLPFSFEVVHLIDLIFGIEINPFNEIILFIIVIGLLMLAVLALKRGNPEKIHGETLIIASSRMRQSRAVDTDIMCRDTT